MKMRRQQGFGLMDLALILAGIAIVIAIFLVPSKPIGTVLAEATPCTQPKYKVGDVVTTHLRDAGLSEESHIGQVELVWPNIAENGQCHYSVIYYIGGNRISWHLYEFELKAHQ